MKPETFDGDEVTLGTEEGEELGEGCTLIGGLAGVSNSQCNFPPLFVQA